LGLGDGNVLFLADPVLEFRGQESRCDVVEQRVQCQVDTGGRNAEQADRPASRVGEETALVAFVGVKVRSEVLANLLSLCWSEQISDDDGAVALEDLLEAIRGGAGVAGVQSD
jgi:hypothetical protein